MTIQTIEGVLLVNKAKGHTSFKLVYLLRKKLGVQKIGHAGTLDPLATGVMVMLIGKKYTKLSDRYLSNEKEYVAEITLGQATDTYDSEGKITSESPVIPPLEQILQALTSFQGEVKQTPPMFSAKKIKGKKLYDLARKGIEVERKEVSITLETTLIKYAYPILELKIKCSKGTYIRSIANDLGNMLGCGAHLSQLTRTRSGEFILQNCISEDELQNIEVADLLNKFLKINE